MPHTIYELGYHVTYFPVCDVIWIDHLCICRCLYVSTGVSHAGLYQAFSLEAHVVDGCTG